MGPAGAIQPRAAGLSRFRHRDHGPLHQPLPADPAADRRRWVRARPEPDDRDHRSLRSAGDRRQPDFGVNAQSARAWRLAGALCGLVVAVDQAVKAIIESNLYPGEHVDVIGPFGLTLAHNTGVAFGIAGDGGGLLVAFALGSLGFIGWLFSR